MRILERSFFENGELVVLVLWNSHISCIRARIECRRKFSRVLAGVMTQRQRIFATIATISNGRMTKSQGNNCPRCSHGPKRPSALRADWTLMKKRQQRRKQRREEIMAAAATRRRRKKWSRKKEGETPKTQIISTL